MDCDIRGPLVDHGVISSPLMAKFMHICVESLSRTDGLILGSLRTRSERDISDQSSEADRKTTILFDILKLVASCHSKPYLFDGALEPVISSFQRVLGMKHLENSKKETVCSEWQEISDEIFGWFEFTRLYDNDCFYWFEWSARNLWTALGRSFNRPLFFLLGYERSFGSQIKFDTPEVKVKLFQYDPIKEILVPINFKILNVGDTSRKEYKEILDQRISSNANDFQSQITIVSNVTNQLEKTANELATNLMNDLGIAAFNISKVSKFLEPFKFATKSNDSLNGAGDHVQNLLRQSKIVTSPLAYRESSLVDVGRSILDDEKNSMSLACLDQQTANVCANSPLSVQPDSQYIMTPGSMPPSDDFMDMNDNIMTDYQTTPVHNSPLPNNRRDSLSSSFCTNYVMPRPPGLQDPTAIALKTNTAESVQPSSLQYLEPYQCHPHHHPNVDGGVEQRQRYDAAFDQTSCFISCTPTPPPAAYADQSRMENPGFDNRHKQQYQHGSSSDVNECRPETQYNGGSGYAAASISSRVKEQTRVAKGRGMLNVNKNL